MFKNILVPTDGSEISHQMAQHAVTFARDIGAKITAFYAKPEYPVVFYGEGVLIDPATPEKYASMMEERANEYLGHIEKMCAEASVPFSGRSTVSDTPYKAIINAADDAQCDLIFMASHGRRGLSAILLGSETSRVLTHTSIPVLVYR